MSSTQYERQARAVQNEIDRLEAAVEEARKESSVAIKEFEKARAVTLRREKN
jgi:hypothetical protein